MTSTTDSDVRGKSTALASRDAAREAFEFRQLMKVSAFGTRKDGRPYPKGLLDFRGRIDKIEKFEDVIEYFRGLARKNNLPDPYAYHLIRDLSNSSLRVRFKLTEQEAEQLKEIASVEISRSEGGAK